MSDEDWYALNHEVEAAFQRAPKHGGRWEVFRGRTKPMLAVVAMYGTANVRESRWNCKGKCKTCGVSTSALGHYVLVDTAIGKQHALRIHDDRLFLIDNGRAILPCRGCGVGRFATRVKGKYAADKACNDKCMAATGPTCECNCGGRNHGGGCSL